MAEVTNNKVDYLSTLNAGSGLNTTQIIDALVDAEIVPQENQLKDKIEEKNVSISGMGQVKQSLTSLKTILGGLLSGYELINSGVAGPGQILSTDVSLIDVKSTSSYSIDLGLNSYSYFGGQSANARKVCFVTPRGQTTQTIPTNCPPCGYFIVNKADVTFGLINILRQFDIRYIWKIF